MTATGHLRSIVLHWTAATGAGGGVAYRLYRREPGQEQFEPATPDTVADSAFVDSRIETGRDYCYVVRAVQIVRGLEVEGPASPEICSRSASDELPPAAP